MVNGYTLVGRIARLLDDCMIISVVRSYKNQDGEYESDFFNIYMSNNILDNTKKYCKVGDIVGVKGHMQSIEYTKDSTTYRRIRLLADKVTFLSSSANSAAFSKGQDIEDEEADSDEEQYSH